jgi:hypothetical protein
VGCRKEFFVPIGLETTPENEWWITEIVQKTNKKNLAKV